jgi:hypothetical protein
MKLSQMTRKPTLKQLNKVTESRFGFKIDYDSITYPRAMAMRGKIMETVNQIRKTSAIHTAEKDPKYLEMLIVYEGLSRWIDAYKGQQARRKLRESEMGKSEAILAAKDMVDTAQDMIEKVGKMQNEQLPALIDTIRDQIGSAEADTYKAAVGQVLATLSTQLGQAREQLDGGARGLTGEGAVAPGAEMGGGMDAAAAGGFQGGAQMPDLGAGGEDDGGVAPPDEDSFGATDAAAGGAEALGRGRR